MGYVPMREHTCVTTVVFKRSEATKNNWPNLKITLFLYPFGTSRQNGCLFEVNHYDD